MATYGKTTPDNLSYPIVTSEAANVPPALKTLADDVQRALTGKVPATRKIIAGNGLTITNAGQLNADPTLNLVVGTGLAVTADSVNVNYTTLDTVYPRKNHTHLPSQVGFKIYRNGPYSVNAADEKPIGPYSKLAGEIPFITVQHASAYIFAVVTAMTSTSYTIKIRNSTQSTDHTGIYIHIAVVTDA